MQTAYSINGYAVFTPLPLGTSRAFVATDDAARYYRAGSSAVHSGSGALVSDRRAFVVERVVLR
ncbi:hypothetical protein [Sorangium sp. So ce388]|uniref:hypothetical protein n=1 Tax=Sorangium sp. So ce388 TaxID=3133309 RepID=UPI003F5C47DB